MQTRCPSCKTVFRVHKAQLKQADGIVRCGQCQNTFNGYDQMVSAKEKAAHYTPEMLKNMLLGRPASSPAATLGWSLAITLTALALLLQLLYIKRDWLAKQSYIGPQVELLCENSSWCALTPYRDLSQIQLVSRNVYSHPNIERALMIAAVLTNSAPVAQRFPTLLVSMSNVHGQIVATRYFKPEEYLPGDPDNSLMEPGKAIPINLEVMDPGQAALAFELDFI